MDGDNIPRIMSVQITSKEDISLLYNYCISRPEETIPIEVTQLYDAVEFIKSGFEPNTPIRKHILLQYLSGIDLNTIEFWYGFRIVQRLENLNTITSWKFNKLSYYIKHGIEKAESYGLILYAPNKLYKSLRPITDMSIFQGPGNRTISRNQIIDNTVTLDNEVWNVIPVTRYAAGMSKGLYNEESKQSFCGTFYYNEPESNTLLAYRTSRTFFNKTAAVMILDPNAGITMSSNLKKHMEGVLPSDLRMTPQEFYYSTNSKKSFTDDYVDALPEIKHYIGEDLGLYAQEDYLDQRLCLLGKKYGIDIIILTHMVGSHQVVTEVLDTRPREDSFKSLIYIRD